VQRRRGRLRWPRIAAQDGVPADRKHVQKHVNAVAEHIHFGSRRMPPPHGNLGRMKSVMPCQVEEFRIEAEALDALLLEKKLARFTPEGFEAALRVDEGQSQN